MKNKRNCLKVKLLHKLRCDAYNKFGVFKENNTYTVVFDKSKISYDVSRYNRILAPEYYQIIDEGIENVEEAICNCDSYRMDWILDQVRKLRYKSTNENRYY